MIYFNLSRLKIAVPTTGKPGWNTLAYRFHECLIQLDESPLWYQSYANPMWSYQTHTWHNWEWSAWLNWSKKLCSLTCDSCTTCTCGCFSGGSLSSCNALSSRINLQHALTDERTWTVNGQGVGREARETDRRTDEWLHVDSTLPCVILLTFSVSYRTVLRPIEIIGNMFSHRFVSLCSSVYLRFRPFTC